MVPGYFHRCPCCGGGVNFPTGSSSALCSCRDNPWGRTYAFTPEANCTHYFAGPAREDPILEPFPKAEANKQRRQALDNLRGRKAGRWS